MPDKKAERPEGQMLHLSIMFLREERFFLEESQETVQSIRERLL